MTLVTVVTVVIVVRVVRGVRVVTGVKGKQWFYDILKYSAKATQCYREILLSWQQWNSGGKTVQWQNIKILKYSSTAMKKYIRENISFANSVWNTEILSRSWQSQELLYKHHCHYCTTVSTHLILVDFCWFGSIWLISFDLCWYLLIFVDLCWSWLIWVDVDLSWPGLIWVDQGEFWYSLWTEILLDPKIQLNNQYHQLCGKTWNSSPCPFWPMAIG